MEMTSAPSQRAMRRPRHFLSADSPGKCLESFLAPRIFFRTGLVSRTNRHGPAIRRIARYSRETDVRSIVANDNDE